MKDLGTNGRLHHIKGRAREPNFFGPDSDVSGQTVIGLKRTRE